MSQNIPQEIIELIVETFRDSSSGRESCKPSLQSCRLVSHAFGLPARRILLSSLRLRNISNLLARFDEWPELLPLLRALHFDIGESMPPHDLSLLLEKLRTSASKLCTIRLTLPWRGQLRPENHEIYATLVRLPGMTSLQIIDMNCPLSFVTNFPSLRSLQLYNSTLDGTDSKTSQKPRRLDGLVIHGKVCEFNQVHMQTSTMFPRSRKIELFLGHRFRGDSCTNQYIAQGRLLILESSQVLESLTIILDASNVYHLGLINLGRLPCLQRLSMHVDHNSCRGHNGKEVNDFKVDAMGAVFMIFRPMTTPTRITAIDLVFTIRSCHAIPKKLFSDPDKSWRALRPPEYIAAHPSLKTVSIFVYWTIRDSVPRDINAEDQIKQAFRAKIQDMIFGDVGQPPRPEVHFELTTRVRFDENYDVWFPQHTTSPPGFY